MRPITKAEAEALEALLAFDEAPRFPEKGYLAAEDRLFRAIRDLRQERAGAPPEQPPPILGL
jgi:hypothetical protein